MTSGKLAYDFLCRDVLEVAPDLIGQTLVCKLPDGNTEKRIITEVEAYNGEGDMACHASKGKTERNKVMYEKGGHIYVYLVYGMYWMLNFVTGKKNDPQAVLIRGIEGYDGPGKLTRFLKIDRSFYGDDLTLSKRIWIESSNKKYKFVTTPRIGIDYAGEYWKNVPWRFVLKK
jgi:DNA-3-methyladenine glycosylase